MPKPAFPITAYGEDLGHLKAQPVGLTGRTVSNVHMFTQQIVTLHGVTRVSQMFNQDGSPMCPQLLMGLVPAHFVFAIRNIMTDPQIGLNERWRECAAHPQLYLPIWENGLTPDPMDLYPYLGRKFIESPRGGVSKPGAVWSAVEAAEELGLKVDGVIRMGTMNQDAAWTVTGPVALIALMSNKPSEKDQYEGQSVVKGLWYTPEQMADTYFEDAITAGLAHNVRAYLRQLAQGKVETSLSPEIVNALVDLGKRL